MMMLKFVSGDFFDFDANIRVNTVNCVGVMGAGVALAFKQKYPEMYSDYIYRCKTGEIKPGIPTVWKSSSFFDDIEIINFPTKNHWRRPSKYEYIEKGLVWLSEFLYNRPNATVTLPALGCGHGGLDWETVKNLIVLHLQSTPANVLVFEPAASRNIPQTHSLKNSFDLKSTLFKEKITVLSNDSDLYPSALHTFTSKDLYVYGDTDREIFFDLSIISSTKPEPDEKKYLSSLLAECKRKKLSVLFGASAFDKNLALRYAATGLSSGVFLPSGILLSAKKLENTPVPNLTLLSIGSPDQGFNRKEYLPSIISRSLLAFTTIFTTTKFEWISKQHKHYQTPLNKMYFVNYSDLPKADFQAASDAELIMLDPQSVSPFPI